MTANDAVEEGTGRAFAGMTARPVADGVARFAADLAALGVGPADPLALAVSGGADSLALLLLAAAARPGGIVAATIDHRLRAASADEAALVAIVCARLGVSHAALAVSVEPGGSGIQAAARRARYAALEAWAVAAGAAALLTAHHADDQAETILMRLARGSGIGGLSAIRPARPLGPIRLLRPLLGWRKAELAAIVAEAGLVPADDPSNRDLRHDRTHARALIAATPWLDPARIAAIAPALQDAEAALAWSTADAAATRIAAAGSDITLDIGGLPRELRRRLLLQAIAIADGGAPPPRGPAVMRLMAALERGRPATLGRLRIAPGPPWRIGLAPPRRARPPVPFHCD